MTKLSSSLPKGEANGLSAIARALVDEPHRVHVVIALVDCKKVTVDHDSGDTEPSARIRRIEAVLPQDHRHAEAMLRRTLDERIGLAVLPYDLEEDLKAAFDGVDHRTGENFRGDDDDEDGNR